MLWLIIAVAGLLAVAIGYFFNIYVVLALAALLCFLFIQEGRRPNTLPGTSGKMGGMILGFIVLAPFVTTLLITSFIVNRDKVAALFKMVFYYFSPLFLR